MKHDEINLLSKEEINIQIAKLRNEYFEEHLPECWSEGNTPDGLDGWSGFACPRCNYDSRPYCIQYNYTNDLNDAWKLVDEILSLNNATNRYNMHINFWNIGSWEIELEEEYQEDYSNQNWSMMPIGETIGEHEDHETKKPDICLAICRAWLCWKTN